MDTEAFKVWVKEKYGSQEKAAQKIGISLRTLTRWIHKEKPSEPSPLALEKLGRLGFLKK